MAVRNRWALTVALLTMGVLAAPGCHRAHRSSGSSYSSSTDIFTIDHFPGPPVDDGNVADDGRAWSPSGTNVILGTLKCTPNGDRGTMMATYGVRTTGATTTDTLMGQYYDGSRWTPPVSLGATDANFLTGSVVFTSVVHAWVNTAENVSEPASDRDGDCVIFWSANDADDDGLVTFTDGVNRNLYATYFNSRQSSSVLARFGFQEFASRLSTRDELGEDVTAFGVATDGLCGEARWETGSNFYQYGQSTTGIEVFWNQRENNDGIAGFDDRALYAVHVQLDAPVTSDLPLVGGAGIGPETRIAIDGMGASDDSASISGAETQVDHQFVSYNGLLVFRVAANNTTPGDDVATHVFDPAASDYNSASTGGNDASLEAVTFDLATGAVGPATLLHLSTPLATDALRDDADFIHKNTTAFASGQASTFGPDEGLANVVMFATESDGDTNDSKTDPADQDGIAVYQVDAVDGALIAAGAVSLANPAISDFVDSRAVSVRISRNGDYILLAWAQQEDSLLSADVTIKVSEYFTTRPADDGTFTILPLASTLSAPVNAVPDVDGISVEGFAFQDNLGYICGQQSDPDVMNIVVSHPDAVTDRLLLSRVVASHFVPVSAGVTTTVLEVAEAGTWPPGAMINDDGFAWKITDSGEGGNVFAVYNMDVDPTAGADIRVFARRTGFSAGSGPIDSNVTFRQAGYQAFTFVSTPAGRDIGVFDPVSGEDSEDRPHGAGLIHLLFREQKTSESSGNGFALRTRVFDTGDNGLAFGDSFTPMAGSTFLAPFDLDLPFVDPGVSEDATMRGAAVNDDNVGIWFTETGHLYYQEWSPHQALGWVNVEGVSEPLLVDDDTGTGDTSGRPVKFFHLFVTPSCTCATLHGATVWYSKTADDSSSADRLFVRSHE